MFSARYGQKIINLFGTNGQLWLDSLPNICRELRRKWQLGSCKPIENLSYNYVCKGYSDKYKAQVVIKIGCDARAIFREVNALKFYNSNSCVRMIDHDINNNAILLEELKPGTSLKKTFSA